jgi:lipopolysaccharide/colanic/teichoic acid biosynthesis glycosyltransferase
MAASGVHHHTFAPATPAAERAAGRLDAACCRALDLAGAVALLIVLAPLLAAIVIAIRLDSSGRAIYRQRRLGRDQRPFTVNKFRTMRLDAAHDEHRAFVLALIDGAGPVAGRAAPVFKMAADARVTRLGHFLRSTSLDELPQLWNVVRGEMSLVGPRPPIPYEVEHYPSHWFARFAVRPGLTGLWQVSGRSEIGLEQMIALDVEYVRRRSLATNLRILLRTVPVVLCRRGAL